MTWRWLSWFQLSGRVFINLSRAALPKPYVMLQLGAAFEALA